jgi:RNA polymerase sigma factor (sigma-70 family)
MIIQTVDRQGDSDAPDRPPADGLLLDRFASQGNQDAFAELMNRHGPYILGVCRRLTYHQQDAEDVFQACFLELVRKANSIRQQGSVAGWLQTVAVRLSKKARARRARRHEKEAAAPMKQTTVTPDDLTWSEVRQIVEEEIARLPENMQAPIIQCLFRGQTQDEAAQYLEVNSRTLKERLRKGRELLSKRLTRRGITLSVLGTILSTPSSQAAVSAALQQATIKAASAVATKTSLTGIVPPAVLSLTGSSGLLAGWGPVLAAVLGLLLSATAAYVVWDQLREPEANVAKAPEPVQAAPVFRTIHHSFRGKDIGKNLFLWTGPTPKKYWRAEDEGLRLTFPAENGPGQPVGVKLRYAVRGDFEVNATVEFLNVVPGIKGWGPGGTLYFFMDSEDCDGIWFGKMVVPKRGPVFSAGHRVKKGKERSDSAGQTMAAQHETGLARLRAVRKGASFSFFGADGAEGDFRHLTTLEVSDADVDILRFAADPAWLKNAQVDLRLVDITITAQDFIGYEPKTP